MNDDNNVAYVIVKPRKIKMGKCENVNELFKWRQNGDKLLVVWCNL